MRLISHRGNLQGPNPPEENKPDYIDLAASKGYDVEIDIRVVNGVLLLGHDHPDYIVSLEWIVERRRNLWIHCKSPETVSFFGDAAKHLDSLNYFWHQNDTLTLTSRGDIWAHPGSQPIRNSIAVLPELSGDDLSECVGVCSDFVELYRI